MSWKKHFKVVDTNNFLGSTIMPRDSQADIGFKNYQSTLPEVYTGHPNRIERYNQYETMDSDSEINAALDILAEFSTQSNIENKTPFDLFFKDAPSDTEVAVLKDALHQWVSLNDFDKRIFKMFRNTLKYGDQVFVRDPETFKWHWVDNADIVKVIVNESKGKEPEQYVLKNINPNFQNLTVTQPQHSDMKSGVLAGAQSSVNTQGNIYNLNTPGSTGTRFQNTQKEMAIDASHVVHVSLTEGLDPNWPFGISVLESVFKVFKQKELLEDAIIIYRVQRAPERRVFYIDVGNMPAHMAMGYVNRVKNEIHQRRIPTQSGGGANMMDATYNPLSINEDYFFPQTAEGRGSRVDTLQGGSNLGEIEDLRFFTNKLFRALRIPSSYLPTGPDDSNASFTDGRVGTAYIQELRFNYYCERLQSLFTEAFDLEFKLYLKNSGINIDPNIFDLKFNPPQNFAAYRQTELDGQRVSTFQAVAEIPYMSKRFALKRFLGLSAEEMQENEMLWRQENIVGDTGTAQAPGQEVRGIGITPGGIQGDMDAFGGDEENPEVPPPGVEPGTAPQPGGAAAGPAPAQ